MKKRVVVALGHRALGTTLPEQKEAVKRTLESFEQYRVAPPAGTITLEYIPRRSIIVLDSGNNYFEEGLEFYEHSLLQLKHALFCYESGLYRIRPSECNP